MWLDSVTFLDFVMRGSSYNVLHVYRRTTNANDDDDDGDDDDDDDDVLVLDNSQITHF